MLLISSAAAVLSGYFSGEIWQTELPLHTQVEDQTALLELCCFIATQELKSEIFPGPWLFTQTV